MNVISDAEIFEAVGGKLWLEQYIKLYRKVAEAQFEADKSEQLSKQEAERLIKLLIQSPGTLRDKLQRIGEAKS